MLSMVPETEKYVIAPVSFCGMIVWESIDHHCFEHYSRLCLYEGTAATPTNSFWCYTCNADMSTCTTCTATNISSIGTELGTMFPNSVTETTIYSEEIGADAGGGGA